MLVQVFLLPVEKSASATPAFHLLELSVDPFSNPCSVNAIVRARITYRQLKALVLHEADNFFSVCFFDRAEELYDFVGREELI